MRLDHVVFPVRDPRATLRFYREVLQLPLIAAHTGEDWGGFPWLMLIFGLPGGQEIVCVALSGAEAPDYGDLPPDARHYAIALSDASELDAWLARLEELSIDHWTELHGSRRSVYFSDPDGVVLEFTFPGAQQEPSEDATALETAHAWCAQFM